MAAPDSSNVIIPGRGAIFVAPVGTAFPNYKTVTPTNVTGPWVCIGHTSVDNQVALSKDGGDSTTYDSWWANGIEATYAPNVWSLTANALEMTKANFDLAFNGTQETTSTTGGYLVPANVQAVNMALFVLAVSGSGTKRMGLGLFQASITLGDAPEFDREALFELPLAAQVLANADGNVMEWFHPKLDKAAS
jgi:hypothetical protein